MSPHVLLLIVSALDCQSWLVTVQRARNGDQMARSFLVTELRKEAWPVCEELLLPGALSSERDVWAKQALATLAVNGKNPAFAREALIAWWRLRVPTDDIGWVRTLVRTPSRSLRRTAIGLLASAGDAKAQSEVDDEVRSSCASASVGLVMGVEAELAVLADAPLPARVDYVCPSSAAEQAGFSVGDVVVGVDGDSCNGIVACQNRIARVRTVGRAFEVKVEVKGRVVTRIVPK